MHTTHEQARPALRPPSWNTLLTLGHTVAVRAGWAAQEREVSWLLSAWPSAVPCARRITAARLTAWGLRGQATAAELLAGELVGDALRAGPATIRLTLGVADGLVRGEVEARAHRPRPCDRLLARLACCWGVTGRIAWFELPATH
ncbi:hypothetical protein SAMN05444920_120169 [Nonomuraea solani]|uniref:Uncharacterized protein n=1 Tax=Nonomuraea solani TaxID=1144553 RepID=A0A1H6EX15_9ACTN|nr:hypothetical protein [Nonomuraea solani]SEH01465.1 hypothetical protein SAMN05444920_120169 [Nonomuraea solani]